MARDKRTRRDARRRYREQLRAEEERARLVPISDIAATQEPPAAPRRSLLADVASGFRLPDVGGDLRALPWIASHTWSLALPLAAVAGSFLVALDASVFRLTGQSGEPVSLIVARFFYQFTLLPPPVTIVFVAAVLAPRAGWLIGGLVGVISTGAFLVLLGIHGPPDYFQFPLTPTFAVQTVTTYLPIYVLVGAFAGWYRRWLMGMQARTRQRAEERRRAQVREAKRSRSGQARR